MAESNSKDLLELEANPHGVSSTSSLEKLFVGKKDLSFSASGAPPHKPIMSSLPRSPVMGRVKDFLGVLSDSNKKLMEEAKERPDSYDIEVLSGNETNYIEMDLMLGIADLHTPEAVAAAESAMAGRPPTYLAESSSESEDEDDEIEEEDDGAEEAGSESAKLGLKGGERDSSKRPNPKKRPKKIVVLG